MQVSPICGPNKRAPQFARKNFLLVKEFRPAAAIWRNVGEVGHKDKVPPYSLVGFRKSFKMKLFESLPGGIMLDFDGL